MSHVCGLFIFAYLDITPVFSAASFLRNRKESLLTETVRLIALEARIMWQQCQVIDSSVLRNLTCIRDCPVK